MFQLLRTDSSNTDFQNLVVLLDKELLVRDGKDYDFFHQFNKIDNIKYALVAYKDGIAVGCGAIKEYAPGVAEIKRVFVPLEQRRQGIAEQMLMELEKWAAELNYNKLILETGVAQPEAIGLYKKNGYVVIPNFGQYIGIEISVCMSKPLKHEPAAG